MESRAFSPTAVASDGSTARRVAQVAICTSLVDPAVETVCVRVGAGICRQRRSRGSLCPEAEVSGSGRTKARARQRWSDGAVRRQADTLETWGASQRHPLRACGAAADRLPIWILDDGTTLATANCVTKRQRPCVRWTMVIPSAAHRDHESPVTSLSCKVAELRFTVDW